MPKRSNKSQKYYLKNASKAMSNLILLNKLREFHSECIFFFACLTMNISSKSNPSEVFCFVLF
jgi:hypothetical protein